MLKTDGMILQQVRAALCTDEEGGNLVDVVRAAHASELKLAQLQRYADNLQWNKIKDYFGKRFLKSEVLFGKDERGNDGHQVHYELEKE